MKISKLKFARNIGSVLVVTLVISFVIGVTLASYLSLVSTQSRFVARSQIWNRSIAVSEAGIEDGLALLNKNVGTPNLAAWATDYAVDGWTKPGANVYQLTRYMDAAHTTFYTVYITNTGLTPTIRSVSSVPPPTWVYSGGPISRTVVVRASVAPLFNACMAASGDIEMKGNNVATDSFDSSDPLYSTNVLYTASKRKAGGDVVTNTSITNSVLNVGNANIAGHIQTGPSGNWAILNGTVGDLPWVDANTPGIQPGWADNDMNVLFDQVALPSGVVWIPAVSPGAGGPGIAPDGKAYDHIFTSSLDTITTPGNYWVNDSGTIYVGTNVSVRLNVTVSDFKPTSIMVAGVAASEAGRLLCYLNGPPGSSATLGTDDKTQSGRAWNLIFMGLPNCTDISYSGNGDFTGAIYAPNAAFHLSGGGVGYIDFVGASVTRTVQMNGHYHFHYDESLRNYGPNAGYKATSWREY